jgi:hypothetical protein
VEDRCSGLLFLELGNTTPDACEARARDLTRVRGVNRVTWWQNCAFERSDLPRRIRDGRTLVVVEAGEGFSGAPPSSQASESRCFRRDPRPSQGVLTGGRTLGLLVVWISPRTPELSRSLRDWGDFVHIRHIAAAGIPGFTQISVYENVAETDPRYMHLYEFDNPDAETTFSTMIDFVAPRLGGIESEAYTEWADLRAPGGRLIYCNTFRRLGEHAPTDAEALATEVLATSLE